MDKLRGELCAALITAVTLRDFITLAALIYTYLLSVSSPLCLAPYGALFRGPTILEDYIKEKKHEFYVLKYLQTNSTTRKH